MDPVAPGVLAAMFRRYEDLIKRLADGDPAAWGEHPRRTVVDQRWQEVAAINATAAPLTDERSWPSAALAPTVDLGQGTPAT